MTKLIPRGPRLLVKSVFETMTAGGIAIPSIANDRRKVARAEVLAVGDGVPRVDPFGMPRTQHAVLEGDPPQYIAGQVVFFMVGEAVAVDHHGETFLLVKVENVLAVEGPEEESILVVGAIAGALIDPPRLDEESFQ